MAQRHALVVVSALATGLQQAQPLQRVDWVDVSAANVLDNGGTHHRRLERKLASAESYEVVGVITRLIHIITEPEWVGGHPFNPAVFDGLIAPDLDTSAFCVALRLTGITDLSPYARGGVVELPADAQVVARRYLAAYRKGVADATRAKRDAADVQALRGRYAGPIRRATESVEAGIAGEQALQALFREWPPVGGRITVFCEIVGAEFDPAAGHVPVPVRWDRAMLREFRVEHDGSVITNVVIPAM